MQKPRIPNGCWCLFLTVLVFAIYSPSLLNDFVWDDHYLIVVNPPARGDASMLEFWRLPVVWDGAAMPFWRPLPLTAHGVLARVFGLDPLFFHFFNTALHAGVAMTFFCWLRVFSVPPPRAFCFAALYAAHPFCTAAVSYISGSADLFAALFSLTTLLLLKDASQRHTSQPLGWAWKLMVGLAVIAWTAALLSKEWAVLILILGPLVLPVRHRPGFWKAFMGPALVVLFACLAWKSKIFEGYAMAQTIAMAWIDRLICLPASFGFYQVGGLFPVTLRVDRFYGPGSLEYRFWIAAGLILLTAWAWTARRFFNRIRACGAWRGAVWFLLFWFIHSNFPVKLNAHLAEHWMYFGYMGAAWCAADLWPEILPWLGRRGRVAAIVVLAALGTFWAGRSFIRQFDWRHDIVFFQANLDAGARSTRSYFSMGSAFARNGFPGNAIPFFIASVREDPSNAKAFWGLARCYYTLGDYRRAIDAAEGAKKSGSRDPKYDRFIGDCRKALELQPRQVERLPAGP